MAFETGVANLDNHEPQRAGVLLGALPHRLFKPAERHVGVSWRSA
jgi:hypothetical protein